MDVAAWNFYDVDACASPFAPSGHRACERRRFENRKIGAATNYFLTTTINGLSFAALLWTTSAFAFVLALSLRAR